MLGERIGLLFDLIDWSQVVPLEIFRQELEVPHRGEDFDHFQTVALVGYPEGGIVAAEIDRDRVGSQGLLTLEHILRKERQREFPQGAVDRVTVAEEGTVAFGDRSPVATPSEQGDDMVNVVFAGPHVHEQRPATGHPEGTGGNECPLNAMGLPQPKYLSD